MSEGPDPTAHLEHPLAGDPPALDPWLVPPDNPPQRVADKRRQPMRLSALFQEFLAYLQVEKEAANRTVQTYRWCFGDFTEFSRKRLGGTVAARYARQLREVGCSPRQVTAQSPRPADQTAPQEALAACAEVGNC